MKKIIYIVLGLSYVLISSVFAQGLGEEEFDFIKLRAQDKALSLHQFGDYGDAVYAKFDEQVGELANYPNKYKKYKSPTRCSFITEMPQAIMCVSAEQSAMNDIFTRISIFSEGTLYYDKEGEIQKVASGTLVSRKHPAFLYLRQTVGGHNIMGSTLIRFYNQTLNNKSFRITDEEKALYEKVVLPLQKKFGENFAVITGSVETAMSKRQLISHEALHAAYFLYPEVQTAVKQYWNNELVNGESGMSEEDRVFYIQTLNELGYNTDDQYVLMNEFFAYTLNHDYDDEYTYTYDKAIIHHDALRAYVQEQSNFNLDSILEQ